VLLVPHIYHIPEVEDIWSKLARIGDPMLVLTWLFPRPAEWVLRRHGVGRAGLVTLDMGAHEGPEQCFEACAPHLAGRTGDGTVAELTCAPATRWYPVLDYSRCVNCKQCLQFCLFGVYTLDGAGKVTASSPDNCKPGCPACARVCPSGAIMFPLYEKDKGIAGAPGQFAKPDAAAKTMFTKRTRRPHRQPEAADDLDALIDDLDRLAQGRS